MQGHARRVTRVRAAATACWRTRCACASALARRGGGGSYYHALSNIFPKLLLQGQELRHKAQEYECITLKTLWVGVVRSARVFWGGKRSQAEGGAGTLGSRGDGSEDGTHGGGSCRGSAAPKNVGARGVGGVLEHGWGSKKRKTLKNPEVRGRVYARATEG